MRDFVRMDRDQADGALALERAEPFGHACGRQAEAPMPGQVDGDEIAVSRFAGGARRNVGFASDLLLDDRDQPPAAARQCAENPDLALLPTVQHLDDAPSVTDGLA